MGALWLAVGSILDKYSGLGVGHGQNNELGGYLFAQKWIAMGIPWLHMFLKVVTCGDLTGATRTMLVKHPTSPSPSGSPTPRL